MTLHSRVEVWLGALASRDGVGEPAPHLRHIVRRPLRHFLINPHEAWWYGQVGERVVGRPAPLQVHALDLRAASALEGKRAFSAVDFQFESAAVPWDTAHVSWDYCPAFQRAVDEYIVRGGNINHAIRVGLMPLRHLRGYDRRNLFEFAQAHAESVDGVTERDSEGVRA